MSAKNNKEIIIAGKSLTLSGYESEEYLQQIADYLDLKIHEFSKMDTYLLQTPDLKNVLMQLNIADDYFKAKKRITELEADLVLRDKDVYELKHDLVSLQMKLDKAQNESSKAKQEVKRMKGELRMLNDTFNNMSNGEQKDTKKQ